jgi:hypothetical protein
MGTLRSLMTPYLPKISRTWSSLTFRVNASTTICNLLVTAQVERLKPKQAVGLALSFDHLTFALLGAGDPSLGVGLRV